MPPCEAEYPIDAASGVPWMPTPGALKPIQRVPSGFPGPGGTGFSPFAQSEAGGYHHGCRCIVTIEKWPTGVGYWDCPVATPRAFQSATPRHRLSRFDSRLITMIGPKRARVTVGTTAVERIRTGVRVCVLSAATI